LKWPYFLLQKIPVNCLYQEMENRLPEKAKRFELNEVDVAIFIS